MCAVCGESSLASPPLDTQATTAGCRRPLTVVRGLVWVAYNSNGSPGAAQEWKGEEERGVRAEGFGVWLWSSRDFGGRSAVGPDAGSVISWDAVQCSAAQSNTGTLASVGAGPINKVITQHDAGECRLFETREFSCTVADSG